MKSSIVDNLQKQKHYGRLEEKLPSEITLVKDWGCGIRERALTCLGSMRPQVQSSVSSRLHVLPPALKEEMKL
jgi:hypothetical protein